MYYGSGNIRVNKRFTFSVNEKKVPRFLRMQAEELRCTVRKVSTEYHGEGGRDTIRPSGLPMGGLIKGGVQLLLLVSQRLICCLSLVILPLDQALLVTMLLIVFSYVMSDSVGSACRPGVISACPHSQFQARLVSTLAGFSRYEAPWWCLNNHWSTMMPLLLFVHPPLRMYRQPLVAKDGSPIGVDWHLPVGDVRGIVLTVPGLNGTSQGGYIVDLMKRMGEAGFAAAVVHGRGAGRTNIHSVESAFHLGRTSDLLVCLEAVEAIVKDIPVYILGYSAGGIRAVKFASVYGDSLRGRVAGIMSFGGVLKNHETARMKASSLVYQPVITHAYAAAMYEKLAALTDSPSVDIHSLFRTRSFDSFADFDRRVTAVLHNMTVDEYEKSVFPYHDDRWKNIAIPTLIINAIDDPVLHIMDAVIPEIAAVNSHVTFLVTAHGGHIGWPTGTCPKKHGYKWISDVARAFIRELEHSRHTQS